ncbi:hypothetical protein E1B28_007378 [Marasmius oreades]|uniref:Uncharacterized protein n=1 Tax=Marasmius oreades TaxID=181124 RepID=A0A9P7S2V9_9AGAR|nr:uncharacterized protein E1B28_007378 [Marasmius oreades]KAG7093726.1 hypothetical protein E1B28_007378 [Marasmius oreades]
MRFHHTIFFVSLLSIWSLTFAADLQQAFIDDEEGDSLTRTKPTYIGGWGGVICSTCLLKPDTTKAYKGTWHDTTHFASSNSSSGINFEFTGVSLEVFCILPPNNVEATINYSLSFNLDGKEVGMPFVRTPENLTTEYQYNVSVVNLENLTNTEHNFTLALDNTVDSVALFDYAVYQFESSATGTAGGQPTSVTQPAQTGSNGAMTDFRFGFGEKLLGTALTMIILSW